jgi:hypothetical protein
MNAHALLPEEAAPSAWPILGPRSDRAEIKVQMAFRRDARMICPAVRIVAVPNGTFIASQAGRRKAQNEGLSAGFPDVMCLAAGKIAFLEMKAGSSGKVSKSQAEWLDWLSAAGFYCGVFRCPDTALSALRNWGFPFVERNNAL